MSTKVLYHFSERLPLKLHHNSYILAQVERSYNACCKLYIATLMMQ